MREQVEWRRRKRDGDSFHATVAITIRQRSELRTRNQRAMDGDGSVDKTKTQNIRINVRDKSCILPEMMLKNGSFWRIFSQNYGLHTLTKNTEPTSYVKIIVKERPKTPNTMENCAA